jgi:integrase
MPKRRRSENRGLPRRWQFTHGAYYYRVPPGLERYWDGKKRFRLGSSLPEAHRTYAERVEVDEKAKTIGDLLDKYLVQVVPAKAPKTRYDNVRQIAKLRMVFGEMQIRALEPHHVYKYCNKRGAETAARRELEVLSHAFTKAVEWNDIKVHPFKGQVRLEGLKPRTRYVKDWEVEELFTVKSKRAKGSIRAVHAYLRLKLLTGMSRGDLLRLEPETHFEEDGIHVVRNKTKKRTGKLTIYQWTDELRRAVQEALAARPVEGPTLFCTIQGKSYIDEKTGTAKAWDSLWDGFMKRVYEETKVKERFTEHDLRAKVGSDAESLERARALLQHIDASTTNRIYRRRPEVVRPTR